MVVSAKSFEVNWRSLAATVKRQIGRADVILLFLSVVLFVLAASGISLSISKNVARALVVFDITQSMNVRDMRWENRSETRLETAKQIVQESLRTVPCGSDIGIGIFTGHRSFVLFKPVEVCKHFAEITSVINEIDWRMAWAARSEVAKGVHSGLLVSKQIGDGARLIFITDGHEAPPVNPKFLPSFRGEPGEVKGAILGVGGEVPLRIPKYDLNGKFIGYWRAIEVQQVDSYTAGRPVEQAESLSGVNTEDLDTKIASGTEHLSSLKEFYLQSVAERLKLDYSRIISSADVRRALLSDALVVSAQGKRDISRWIAALGFLCLLAGIVGWPTASRLKL